MQIRRANMEDMYEMQHCNLCCLPENYNLRYYFYHILSWPQLLHVQQDYNGDTVGYVLAKMDDEESAEKRHGHITSLSVLRTHRKLGIASRVMKAAMKEMDEEYKANFCSLHVRVTNDAALHLYQDSLDFRCAGVEEAYYVDSEDAYHMKYFFRGENKGTYITENGTPIHKPVSKETAAATAVVGGTSKKPNAKELENEMAELLEQLETGKGGKGGNKGGNKGGKGKKK
ncbi:peptide alpha-N-acetyltransferase [Angomonas deanei]|uniref:Acetyltransferase (GNAT) family/Acetyltransferase (GNAT) domain/FR47-like protein, putative n=1 Tax=Angomonas deanei TaxID=59799 RepID=S9VSN4_9TRYP|nr:peptide alpha-N-acetyltransferase [Angomonas deanei]EPY42811.1 peptide alpha-N-acetyltransferase [Angomonas deanei]EPY43919.1 peptide alpha-N-acetyltransferase [Angomonas deanei]CAD2219516.1 Acetyltransferase (GNAT) family/Acetyltransferase (GNAT) domain/FR47-like protein, putative [Angomonas deanei]|eukprot:EPY29892.1 peptide alpha-N-acetyltransferase [Angomonas deanei]